MRAVRTSQAAFLAAALLNCLSLAGVVALVVGAGGVWPSSDAAPPAVRPYWVAPLLVPAGGLVWHGADADATLGGGSPRFSVADAMQPRTIGATDNPLAAGLEGSPRVSTTALLLSAAAQVAVLAAGCAAVLRLSPSGLSLYLAATTVLTLARLTGSGLLQPMLPTGGAGTPTTGIDTGHMPGLWAGTRLLLDGACALAAARLRTRLAGGTITSLRPRYGLY